jgi:hypothetical protein
MALSDQAGRETAAIYLMGYSAELALKVAICELLGVPPSVDPWGHISPNLPLLGLQRLTDIKNHDVKLLWKQANDRREGIGLDTRDPAFHGALAYHAWVVYTNWWEELRYKNESATVAEVADVAESTFWLLTNLQEIYQ